MTEGDGLTVGGADNNELEIELTEENATLKAGIYFLRLFSVTENKTWLNGRWEFHNGLFGDVTTDSEIVVNTGDQIIYITLTSGDGSSVTLTDGNGTTASGTAVDLGGEITGDIELYPDVDGSHDIFIGLDASESVFVDNVTISAATLIRIAGALRLDIVGGSGTRAVIVDNDGDVSGIGISGSGNLSSVTNAAVVLTNAASIDIASAVNTLSSSSATRTFTISYTGDVTETIVTLTNTAATYTFPATALCLNSAGTASGTNTATLAGVSGDKYIIMTSKVGSDYFVIVKNLGQ